MDNRMSLLTSPFVPEGMVDLMKKLSKGVIKERPANIYEYAAAFFEKMLIERDGSLDKGYGKFRSYTEYCKFMDKMDQRRLSQTIKKEGEIVEEKDVTDGPQEEVVQLSNIEVQGVAIQGVERKGKDSVKNVSINPKYKSQSEKTATKPVVSSVKNVKSKPRKLSSKKPSENLIVIKEETSADVDDSSNGESNLHKAAMTIQKAFRMYMGKKSSQDGHSSETFENVSQLSEDAAAVIIQKAFKSLIQKLKPEAQSRKKAVDESNNNVVIAGAGQENDINVDKIKNNADEHSEQILVDDDRTGTEHDLEQKDNLHKDASENAATKLERNEVTNLETIIAIDSTEAQHIDTEEKQIEENKSASDGGNNQVAIASDNNYETGFNEDLGLPSTANALNMKTEISEIQEAIESNRIALDELQLKVEEEDVKNDPVAAEVQPSENEVAVRTSEILKSDDTQVKNLSDDPKVDKRLDQADTEAIQNQTETALENKSNFSDYKDVSKIASESKQDNTAAPPGTDSVVDHSFTVTNNETEILPSEKQEIENQQEPSTPSDTEPTMLVEPSENTSNNISAQEQVLTDVSDNIEKNSSSTDNNLTEVKVLESPVKEQLFVVEKGGIYVNMDLLQEKFGTTAIEGIDDGAGSDSEKTFKLNILEREEILVNQENVQQLKEVAEVAIESDIVHKSPTIMADESKGKIVENVENTVARNCDMRDEEGNEEYELAETVVLMDIPNKSHLESENLLQAVAPENGCIESVKLNKLNEEIDKLGPCADEKRLERFSDSVKILDEEVAETISDVDEVMKKAAVEKLDAIEHQLNKTEHPESITNLQEHPINEHDGDEKTKLEYMENQINENELTASNSEDTVKTDVVSGEGDTKNETEILANQLNQNESPEFHSEKVVLVETVEEEQEKYETDGNQLDVKVLSPSHSEALQGEETKDEKQEGKVDKNELPSSNSEKVEAVVEVEESRNDNVESQLTKREVTTIKSDLSDVKAVLEVTEAIDSQCNKTELTTSNSERIMKLKDGETENENIDCQLNKSESVALENIAKMEEVFEDKVVKHESVESQCKETELTTFNSENIVKLEDEDKNENVDTQLNKGELTSEKILKVEVVEEDETNSKNVESQMNKGELTSSDSENIVTKAVEEIKSEKVENQLGVDELHQATDSENVVKTGAVPEGDETKNEDIGSQLNKVESEPVSSSSEVKGSERKDDQLNEENSASVRGIGETNEPVVITEKQLHEKDEENNDELESKICKNDDEKIYSPKTQDVRDTVAEISEEMARNEGNEELVKAATIIQKVFRGYIVRNSATPNSNIPNKKKDELALWAALIIQKYARGYLVRRKMQKTVKLDTQQIASNEMNSDEGDNNRTEDNSITDVVPQLPAYSNRFLIPKDSFLERESFADDEDYARTCKELAATSIQKTYRGYRVRRSLKASSENDAESIDAANESENEVEALGGNDQVHRAVNEAERVISDVLNVAADVLPSETYELDSFEGEVTDEKNVEESPEDSHKPAVGLDHNSVLGQVVHDNVHVEGQMQQKYNQVKFQGSAINTIDEMSDSSEQPETPPGKSAPTSAIKSKTVESDSLDSKDYDGSKSFSYEQLSSDLSDTEEIKRESMKESEVDETSRDERDDLSEVENFDLSSCGEDSLEAMYYSLRKNEIMVDRMKQVAEQREPKNNDAGCETLKVEFPERVTENLDVAMQQVFKSMESSSDYDLDKRDEDDNSSTLDLALDDTSSINDEKEIETSRHIKQTEEVNLMEESEQSESTINTDHDKDVNQSPELILDGDVETSNVEQSQQSDSSVNSSTKFIMKSQSVCEDMMNPIMFAMKRKQALLDQLHVRPYPLQENLSEDHDAFPEHLLTDIDIGNIQRKIFASSVSETDSDYIEPNTTGTGRRLVRDDFNISTALDHLSTDSDSTIISAATKIQAGARGFLTRRRLRRSSAGGTTSVSFEKRYSFGNAAIDKSLEDLIKMQEQINLDGAALKIQQQYRRYQARKNNLKKVSPIREQTTLELSGGSSVEANDGTDDIIGIREITLAQKKVDDRQQDIEEEMKPHPISLNIDTVETVAAVKRTPVNQRRLTLQRGDAVQRNSRPDSQDLNIKDGDVSSPDNQSNEKLKDADTGEYTTNKKKEKKDTANINIQSLINRGIGPIYMRQRSMPVQIDSELMRIIPKHLRKRVKSADMAKKRSG